MARAASEKVLEPRTISNKPAVSGTNNKKMRAAKAHVVAIRVADKEPVDPFKSNLCFQQGRHRFDGVET